MSKKHRGGHRRRYSALRIVTRHDGINGEPVFSVNTDDWDPRNPGSTKPPYSKDEKMVILLDMVKHFITERGEQ